VKRLFQALKRSSSNDDERHNLDHVPLPASHDWRKQRLAEAAQRHGKPFKCAADGMPREIMVGRNAIVSRKNGSAAV
jgi:hypothetical protein